MVQPVTAPRQRGQRQLDWQWLVLRKRTATLVAGGAKEKDGIVGRLHAHGAMYFLQFFEVIGYCNRRSRTVVWWVRELDGVDDMNEPTMAEKLASIDLLGDDKTMDTPRKEPSHPAVPPSADSVHVLLKQALHADDHALLFDCLYTRDEKVIAKSTLHLTPSDVLKLLKSLTSLLQLRGAVLICMLPWLRSLLSQHASSIVSQESSLIMLNSLYQLIESRISTFGSALQLSTSLDYLFATGFSCLPIPEEEAEEEETVPTVVFEDKDSDEESEDAMETDEDSKLGSVINSPQQSDDGEVITD